MGIGNVTGLPVEDSEERKKELLRGVGTNESTVRHCLSKKQYDSESLSVRNATQPKQGEVVARGSAPGPMYTRETIAINTTPKTLK